MATPTRRLPDLRAPLRGLLGPDTQGTRQTLAALTLATFTGIVAGSALGALTTTLERLPGLLVMIPAAVGLRGNIYGALGSRLSTSIHTGTFTLTRRADTVVGQNAVASLLLTLSISLGVALVAKVGATAFGLADTISVLDMALISIVGGVLSSVILLGITLALAARSAAKGWDLDNVTAPIVTATGDVITLPALWLATHLVGIDVISTVLGAGLAFGASAALVLGLRSEMDLIRRILRESVPILLAAAFVSVIAGITIEKRLDTFTAFPALLMVVPGFLGVAGSLGGILSSRLSSKLHLGVVDPLPIPTGEARRDIALVFVLALPVFLASAALTEVAAAALGLASPGVIDVLGAVALAGTLATFFVSLIAYYGTIVAVRLGLDPDTYGIPLVTSSVDLVGAFAFISAIVLLGIV